MLIIAPNRERRQRTVAVIRALGHEHAAVLWGCLDRGANLAILPREKDRFQIPPLGNRGFAAIIQDDYETAEGPPAFHVESVRRLAAQADALFVMSGAPQTSAYRDCADRAAHGEIVLIAETQASHEHEWLTFFDRHGRSDATLHLVSPNGAAYGAPRTMKNSSDTGSIA
jgi:hypothetical protein